MMSITYDFVPFPFFLSFMTFCFPLKLAKLQRIHSMKYMPLFFVCLKISSFFFENYQSTQKKTKEKEIKIINYKYFPFLLLFLLVSYISFLFFSFFSPFFPPFLFHFFFIAKVKGRTKHQSACLATRSFFPPFLFLFIFLIASAKNLQKYNFNKFSVIFVMLFFSIVCTLDECTF